MIKCPLCGGKLIDTFREIQHIGDEKVIATNKIQYLDCENRDYRVSVVDFEAAWTKHAKAISDALEVLLTDLKNANLK